MKQGEDRALSGTRFSHIVTASTERLSTARRAIYFGVVAFVAALIPMSEASALYCYDGWTAAYKCMNGCGCGGSSRPAAPVYQAPAVRQPTQDELLARQATALNNQGVSAYNRGNYREAMRLFELSMKVRGSPKARENLAKTYSQLGVEFFKQKNFAEAVQYFVRANQNLPDNAVIASSLATARSELESQQRQAREQANLEQSRRNIVGNILNRTTTAPTAPPPTPASVQPAIPTSGAMDFMSADTRTRSASAVANSTENGATGNVRNSPGQAAARSDATRPDRPAVSNAAPCNGMFCTGSGPAISEAGTVKSQTSPATYQSASAQAAAAAKPNGGCVFDGGNGCPQGNPLVFNQTQPQRPRGSASLPLNVLEAMSKSPEGRQLMEQEMALQDKLANVASKVEEIKKRKDAATDPKERGRLEVEYTNADTEKSQVAQQLYVARDKVETQAKQYVLDDDTKK